MSADSGIKEITNTGVERAASPAIKKPAGEAILFKRSVEGKKDLSVRDLEKIASEVEIQLKRLNTELRFEVNQKSKEVVIKIIDPDSKQLIRQIPSEEMVAIRERMEEFVGVLFSSKT